MSIRCIIVQYLLSSTIPTMHHAQRSQLVVRIMERFHHITHFSTVRVHLPQLVCFVREDLFQYIIKYNFDSNENMISLYYYYYIIV